MRAVEIKKKDPIFEAPERNTKMSVDLNGPGFNVNLSCAAAHAIPTSVHDSPALPPPLLRGQYCKKFLTIKIIFSIVCSMAQSFLRYFNSVCLQWVV
jgi:hypothetical protein